MAEKKAAGKVVVLINANVHENAGIGLEQYLHASSEMVRALLVTGRFAIIFIPHDFRLQPRWLSDAQFAAQLFETAKEQLPGRTSDVYLFSESAQKGPERFFSARHVKSIVRGMDLVVSGRMHLASAWHV